MNVKLFRRDPIIPDHTEYIVSVPELKAGEWRLSFKTRAGARAYKKALGESKQQITAVITKREHSDGYETDEVVR